MKFAILILVVVGLKLLPRVLRSLARAGLRRLGRARLGPAFSFRDAYVIDGDTIAIGQNRIRLHGIDAPEMSQPQGQAARDFLQALLKGFDVVATPMDRDKYGRLVARLSVQGHDVSAKMVEEGYAIATKARSGPNYGRVMRRARRRGAGLWGRGGFQNPAQWRQARG